MPDVDLQACCAGDGASWDAFVRRYAGVIAAAVRRVLAGRGAGGAGAMGGANEDEVSDCIQDVFVRLVARDFALLKSYDAARASLPTWLTLVARSTAIDHQRKAARTPRAVAIDAAPPLVASSLPPPPNSAPAADSPDIPVHLLSPRQRLVLRLLFDQAMTVPQAAAFIGVDEQTIRSMKNKALTRLRAHLTPG